jgi:twinkle protein
MNKTFGDFQIQIPAGRAGEVDTTCPQCSSQRKKKQARCLSVNVDQGTWHCHHCGWGGGLTQGEKRFDPAWQKPQYRRPEPIKQKRSDPAMEWLAGRGISRDVAERNRIAETSVYMPQVEDHVGAIAFPYYRGDELVNVKYRDREKNFRMEAGAERILYGLNDITPERCVIVEGEMDKLSVEMAGITSCVSVPDGAPAENAKDYASKFAFLDSAADEIAAVKEWIIAVDNDGPGKRLEDELARRLGREKCRRVTWPGDCKDANDVLRSYDAQTLRECIEHAEPYPIAGVFSVLDASSRVRHLREHGWEKGVSTGWDEVDRFYTVRPGEVTVVTGIPNSGKSNWVDALMVNIAGTHGWNIALFSPENQPIEDHIARVVEKFARAPFTDGPTDRMDDKAFEEAMAWANDHFTWILPDDDNEWTLDTILTAAKALVLRKGIRGLVIDPWNELEHTRPEGVSETDYIGKSLRHIRQFARHNGIHIWIVAHPTKLYRDKDGSYPVPTLYDISGSAHFRNKADNGICVWRDFKDDSAAVEIHVQKIRFRQIGRIGLAKLCYMKPIASYREFSFNERVR